MYFLLVINVKLIWTRLYYNSRLSTISKVHFCRSAVIPKHAQQAATTNLQDLDVVYCQPARGLAPFTPFDLPEVDSPQNLPFCSQIQRPQNKVFTLEKKNRNNYQHGQNRVYEQVQGIHRA